MLLCIEYAMLFVDTVNMKIKACNALNAMFVETVDTLLFVAPTEHFIQSTMRCENSAYSSLSPLPGGKAIWAFCLGGLAVHQSEGAALFLWLVKYKGDCRQDAQPIPNS